MASAASVECPYIVVSGSRLKILSDPTIESCFELQCRCSTDPSPLEKVTLQSMKAQCLHGNSTAASSSKAYATSSLGRSFLHGSVVSEQISTTTTFEAFCNDAHGPKLSSPAPDVHSYL